MTFESGSDYKPVHEQSKKGFLLNSFENKEEPGKIIQETTKHGL